MEADATTPVRWPTRAVLAVAAGLMLVSAPGVAGAQTADALDRVLDEVPADRTVRVEVRGDTARPVGRLGTREAEGFTLLFDDGERRIPSRAVERLWVRTGHRGGAGAKIGGLIGFFAGGALVFGYAGTTTGDPFGTIAGGALSGALVGAALGYGIGQGQPEWTLRFEASEGRVGFRAALPPIGGR